MLRRRVRPAGELCHHYDHVPFAADEILWILRSSSSSTDRAVRGLFDHITTQSVDPIGVPVVTAAAPLAGEVNAMCDARWEHLLLTTRDDTLLAVQKLIALVHTAAPELRDVDLDHAEAMSVTPLLFGQREAEIIADVARRFILASKLLGPLVAQLPESSRTWFDARKIVDRLDFDGRELLGYVRRINPDRVSEIFAEVR